MPLSDPLILLITLGLVLILGAGFILMAVRIQSQRIKGLEQRTRQQSLALNAARSARLLLWSEEPDRSIVSTGQLGVLEGDRQASNSPDDFFSVLPTESRLEIRTRIGALKREGTGSFIIRAPIPVMESHPKLTEWHVTVENGLAQGVIRDITAEVRTQEQLIQSQRREAVATLVAGISHEFGNVLAAVDSCSQALLMQELGPDARKAGELIQGSAQRGKTIIRQLLDLSRAKPSATREVDVNEVLKELARLLEPLIPKRIRIGLDLGEPLPRPSLDRDQLHQALLNLCLNARDAMPQGGTLTLRSRLEETGLVLEVSDTGCGMDETTQARIFEPFFTTKEPGRGTGLGLSITKEILESLGGRLLCHSQQGTGTLMQVRFQPRDHGDHANPSM